MRWTILRLDEDDYGCEERLPGQERQTIVTLCSEAGEHRELRVDDCWLVKNRLEEGSVWPETE